MVSEPQFEIRPTAFKRGVPKEEHNGFYGIEEKLVDLPIGREIVVIAVYELVDDKQQRGPGIRFPEVGPKHIEPIWDESRAEAALEMLRAEHKERTGLNQLDFSGIKSDDEDEESEE